jgi:hypothetical protein
VDFKILRIHHLRLNDLQIHKVKKAKNISLEYIFDWFEDEMTLTDEQWAMLTMLVGEFAQYNSLQTPFSKWLFSEA